MNNEVNNEKNQNNLNSENNLSNENKKGYSKIMIIVLVVLLVGALGFICYDKFINTEKPPVPMPSTTPSPVPTGAETVEYDDWMNYLLNHNIIKITYEKDDSFNYLPEYKPFPIVNVPLEKLKEFFLAFKSQNLQLYKEYWGGRGDAWNVLTITYLKDGKEYNVVLESGQLLTSDDDEFIKTLEKLGYKERKIYVEDDNPYPLIVYMFYDAECDVENDDECFSLDYAKYFE